MGPLLHRNSQQSTDSMKTHVFANVMQMQVQHPLKSRKSPRTLAGAPHSGSALLELNNKCLTTS